MTKKLCTLWLFCLTLPLLAQNTREDSMQVYRYELHLDFKEKHLQKIHGYALLQIACRLPASQLRFDLVPSLQVDSVKKNGVHLSYLQYGESLLIDLDNPVPANSNLELDVYYQGKPGLDPSFGGVYFSGNYCYNLGVSFSNVPHTYGRAWFPCLDNFTQRAEYKIYLYTYINDIGIANGQLAYSGGNPGFDHLNIWQQTEPIPTYLVGFAVAPYTLMQSIINGHEVILAAEPADATNMSNSFWNLQQALTAFETHYGPYVWSRVGFTLVPFNGGAMEHATNIAYPRFAADGTLNRETLMAHELSHHWWGNLITCTKAEEMWLNEGWAVFSEFLFTEEVYGKAAYQKSVKDNLHRVLLNIPFQEPHFALNNVPQTHTYGLHSYPKGAAIAHCLRGYMGDDKFFSCIQDMFTEHAFGNFTSDSLETWFEKYTNTDLTTFFNDWVRQPGLPHFRVRYPESGPDYFAFTLEQALRGAAHYYQEVPLEIILLGASGQRVTRSFKAGGFQTAIRLEQLPFEPVAWYLDPEDKLADATITDVLRFKQAGSLPATGNAARISLSNAPSDSIEFILSHHWVGADNKGNPAGLFVMPNRYWTLTGTFEDGLPNVSIRFEYDGSVGGSNLDIGLITFSESTMRLLWRPHEEANWEEVSANHLMGSAADGRGSFIISNIKKGQYTLGAYASVLSGKIKPTDLQSVYPNPGSTYWQLDAVKAGTPYEVYDTRGRLVFKGIQAATGTLVIRPENWEGAHFILMLHPENEAVQSFRLLLQQ